jgi:tRNA-specific 2-thiouridylase
MAKTQVRQIAAEAGLITANKPESQNICFVGGGLRDFLQARLESGPGQVYDLAGNLVGRHRGASFYTVGQRKGLELNPGFGEAYVVRVIPEENILIVGNRAQCSANTAAVNDFNWLVDPAELPGQLWAQVRYRQKPVSACLEGNQVRFLEPQFAVTPGQSLVLYAEDQLVGGGIIAAAQTVSAELAV